MAALFSPEKNSSLGLGNHSPIARVLDELEGVDSEDTDSELDEFQDVISDSLGEPSSNRAKRIAEELEIPIKCVICQSENEELISQLVCCQCTTGTFHRSCGGKMPQHHPLGTQQKVAATSGWGGWASGASIPCEEVSLRQYLFVLSVIIPPSTAETTILHSNDLDTTWFGTPRQARSGPRLSVPSHLPAIHLWPRLQNLLGGVEGAPPHQYPSLVSFIGDTGAGKSTLIAALIQLFSPSNPSAYSTPVRAATDQMEQQLRSTSSDVHLYADPSTLGFREPLLYADCEGFKGVSAPASQDLPDISYGLAAVGGQGPSTYRSLGLAQVPASFFRRIGAREVGSKILKSSQIMQDHLDNASRVFEVEWAANSREASGGRLRPTELRAQVVEKMYPRLLYAFSDVVCYVTNNFKRHETILDDLFEWAKFGHDRTLNQRTKPGLVIAFNQISDREFQDEMLDVDGYTRTFLEIFQKSARYNEMCQIWETRGRPVKSAKELVLRYYHSFKVVVIPTVPKPPFPSITRKMLDQIKSLHTEIKAMSSSIHRLRTNLNMNIDVAHFASYLEDAISTLARDSRSAIDFSRMSERKETTLPRYLSDHVSLVLRALVKNAIAEGSDDSVVEASVIKNATPYIACCIKAQKAKASSQSSLSDLIDDLTDEACRGVEIYHQRYWRCEYSNKTGLRCQNAWESHGIHGKGHQFMSDPTPKRSSRSSVDLSMVEEGAHVSSYDPFGFKNQLQVAMNDFKSHHDARNRLADMVRACGIDSISTQRTCLACLRNCLACLRNCPTNCIPCAKGHAICVTCLHQFSTSKKRVPWLIPVDRCPLGCALMTDSTWSVRVKPRTAAPRILCLDGGGVRGIIQLEILKVIVRKVDFGIPVQELFDLVIGTSTGGLVALGVFEQAWYPEQAIGEFRRLSSKAFVPRFAKHVVPSSFLKHQYRTKGIEDALKEVFKNKYLFGPPSLITSPAKSGKRGQHAHLSGKDAHLSSMENVKTGVVSVLFGLQRPCLISNYSRNPDSEEDWLQRMEKRNADFQTWQAARATSAAPTLFRRYRHESSDIDYVDGAILHNNPVEISWNESRRLWGTESRPDILLSIGTGVKVDKTDGKIQTTGRHPKRAKVMSAVGIGGLSVRLETGLDMVKATLDCQRAWDKFRSSHSADPLLRRNTHRLDVGMPDGIPSLDGVDKIDNMSRACFNYLSPNRDSVPYFNSTYGTADEHIDAVARRLRASLFYCANYLSGELMTGQEHETTLFCRLTPNSEPATRLLQSSISFRLKEVGQSGILLSKIKLAKRFSLETMSTTAAFEIKGVRGLYRRSIEVCFDFRPDYDSVKGGNLGAY